MKSIHMNSALLLPVRTMISTIFALPVDAPSNTISTPSRVPHQTDHTITCSFDSVPTPSIVWSINDTTITSGSGGYTIQNGDSESLLIITNLSLSHQGDYKCEVTNLLGSSSDTANLIVQGE